MMRNNIIPLTLVTVCGVATAIAALQPELKKQQDERLGVIPEATFSTTTSTTMSSDSSISQAIMSDMQEAAREVKVKGVAWGIREALFGKDTPANSQGQQRKPEKEES